MAAITDSPDSSIVYSEKDWNLSSSLTRNPYYYRHAHPDHSLPVLTSCHVLSGHERSLHCSKVVAEKAAYEFVERSKAKFKLVSILPSMVLGPAVNPGVSESVALTVQAVANGEVFRLVPFIMHTISFEWFSCNVSLVVSCDR